MPGYGVPAEGGDLLPFSFVEQRLTAARNYWLATVCPDGRPHLMVVWAVWREDAVLFSSGARSRKARNLQAEPRCSLGAQCDADTELVVVEGVAEMAGRATVSEYAAAVEAKYGFDMSGMLDEPVFTMRPDKIIALDETFSTHATRFTFPR